MKYSILRRVILAKQKGSFSSLIWEKQLPVRQAFAKDNVVTKRCSGVVRCGVNYDNIKSVQSKREIGVLPSVNMGLTWGEWESYPYFIKHKDNIYLRCAESKANKIEVEYFLNGRKVDRSVIEPLCTKAAFTDHASLDVFTVNVNNIISIR